MEESRFGYWARRIAAAVALGLLVALFIGAFRGSTVIANDLLVPRAPESGSQFEIGLVGAGRIVLPRNETTEQPGIWGVSNGTGGYGQLAAVISQDAETVERSFRTLEGRFIAGEMVTFDAYAFGENPDDAFAMDYEEVRVPGSLGANPAWSIPGQSETWAIIIHGGGLDERRQALRVLPIMDEFDMPTLVITYRNDGAAPDDGGYYRWGLTEWQDVEAAITYARNRGAESYVLYGFGMGATIAMNYLHESDSAGEVLGVVLDSPVLDLGAVVDDIAASRGIPVLVSSAAKAVARIRFSLEWAELDQTSRIDEFDISMLLFQGSEDDVAPVATAAAFAAALPDLVDFELFEGAARTELWNLDPERYNAAVTTFFEKIFSPDPFG